MILAVITIAFCLFYAGWMGYCYLAWRDFPPVQVPNDFSPQTKVTVIVPARNEAANIRVCIQSILAQRYPDGLLEVIVVDDHSEDNTAEIAASIEGVRLVRLSESTSTSDLYKKRAIETAVSLAAGELIVTTDADCLMSGNWLQTLVFVYETKHPKLIAGPVIFEPSVTLFEKFQALDFAGMMAITGGTIYRHFYLMCNGANLAYERAAFLAVDGYKGVDKNPSGDDMMLLQKIRKAFPGQVRFVKSFDAVVRTAPMHEMQEFLQQRFRWTSKSAGYKDKKVTAILAMVYLSNWLLVISLICGLFNGRMWFWVLPVFALKMFCDYLVLNEGARFFRQGRLMRVFFPAQLMHIAYIIFVGTLGNILPYRWKGRKVNH